MESCYALCVVLEAHLPYVKEYNKEDELLQAGEEGRFFECLSETLLPLLEMLDRLEKDHVPFRIALVLSPILCHMLCDEQMRNKYLRYIDKQIEFGEKEISRTASLENGDELNNLANAYYNKILDRRIIYTERYEKNLLRAFDFYKRRGKLEILASCATHAFLPFIAHNGESLQAQMETPVSIYRKNFGGTPYGFWLPELGWTPEIEPYLRSYNYSYTIVDSHSLLFGKPLPQKGCFYPVKTANGTFIFARDFYAMREIENFCADEVYRNNKMDAGYELPPQLVKGFLSAEGERRKTGYKYWAKGPQAVYNPQAASCKIQEHVRLFLEKTTGRLEEAAKHMKETPVCVCARNADFFGRFWHEGFAFLETLFRMASGYRDLRFICPGEYLFNQKLSSIQVTEPEVSSGGINGYAEKWLNVTNDWIYRHLFRAMERMTELAERFPDDSGLKERALNQAAREILLAQSSDWPSMLHAQDCTQFAREMAENSLRNFTTIYEALGSNYISTEWLTTLEKKHNIFPNINYRVFRRKR